MDSLISQKLTALSRQYLHDAAKRIVITDILLAIFSSLDDAEALIVKKVSCVPRRALSSNSTTPAVHDH